MNQRAAERPYSNRLVGSRKQLPRGCRLVLDVLKASSAMPTAQEIALQLRRNMPQRAPGLTTIYRSLELLSRMGIVQVVCLPDGERRYEIVSPGEHFHHVICEGCGASVRLQSCILEQITQAVEQDYGFEIRSHILELFGRCTNCRQQNGSQTFESAAIGAPTFAHQH